MDEHGTPRRDVLTLLDEAEAKDHRYKGGRIFGSMCTSPHEFAKEVFVRFMETNLGDAGLFKGTKDLEEKAVSQIAGLLGLQEATGMVISGGTEANILALWAARNLTKKKKVIVPETAHFSLDKACNLLGLEIIKARIDDEKCVDIGDVESKVDKETCAIVGVAGSTEYGSVDDIKALSEVASETDVYLHVDAAFGGFVLPFLKELGYSTRFELPSEGVDSVTVDPHKMGLVPIPCGCILFRDRVIMRFIETPAPYLTQKRQHSLVGTRSGASAASAFAVFKLLGREGYREIVRKCMENTMVLYKGIAELGVEVREPTINILAFKGGENIYNALSERGWQLSRTRKGEIRIIVMPHITRERIKDFLDDLEALAGG